MLCHHYFQFKGKCQSLLHVGQIWSYLFTRLSLVLIVCKLVWNLLLFCINLMFCKYRWDTAFRWGYSPKFITKTRHSFKAWSTSRRRFRFYPRFAGMKHSLYLSQKEWISVILMFAIYCITLKLSMISLAFHTCSLCFTFMTFVITILYLHCES